MGLQGPACGLGSSCQRGAARGWTSGCLTGMAQPEETPQDQLGSFIPRDKGSVLTRGTSSRANGGEPSWRGRVGKVACWP